MALADCGCGDGDCETCFPKPDNRPVVKFDEFMAGACDSQGIHICAQLRVEAMQLSYYGIGWAAKTMERAAKRIEELEAMFNVQF